jgi:DNA-binding MarR family transcriptional regulator
VQDAADRHVGLWSRELDRLDPVAEEIFVRLAILGRHQAQARRDALASGGIQHWQFKVLLILRRQGPPYTAGPSRLADELGLTRGALSARLAAIEEAGWIVRAQDAGDRRRVHVRLTPAGNAELERHLGAEGKGESVLLSTLRPAERRTLADLLRKMVLAAETGPGGPPEASAPGGPQ